jgi:outer membrane receptor protein involved in Fe transport
MDAYKDFNMFTTMNVEMNEISLPVHRDSPLLRISRSKNNVRQVTPMKKNYMTRKSAIKGAALALVFGTSNLISQTTTPQEAPVELSPFSVDGSRDAGYMATSTLAGTRIQTDLKDLGSSIQVITPEFLSDVGANDANTLLSYTTSSEVGGYQGNFAGVSPNSESRLSQNAEKVNPSRNQRIRGLGAADLTRGFFLTDIAFDSYNTERVTVSRGPNSLLFGIGSPGGVIDNSLKPAYTDAKRSNFGEISFRVDNYGSKRASFDVNHSGNARVAVRAAGLHNDQRFKQQQAFDLDERAYVAITLVPFENSKNKQMGRTIVRGNYEAGRSGGAPPEIIPPTIAFHGWFEPVPRSYEQFTGGILPNNAVHPSEGGTWRFQALHNDMLNTQADRTKVNTYVQPSTFRHVGIWYAERGEDATLGIPGSNLQGIQGQVVWNRNRDTLASTGLAGTPIAQGLPDNTRVGQLVDMHTNSPYSDGNMSGFTVPTLQNPKIFDYRNSLYTNGIERVEREFDVKNLAIEQSFFDNNLSFELAYDKQFYSTYDDFVFTGGSGSPSTAGPYDIFVSISTHLTNGQVNPNLGRAYTWVRKPVQNLNESTRESKRATAYANLDFKERNGILRFLGNHRFTGMYNDYTHDTFFRQTADGTDSGQFDLTSAQEHWLGGSSRRSLNLSVFTSDSLLGVNSIDDVRLHAIDFKKYSPGTRFQYGYVDTTAATSPFALNGVAGARTVRQGEIFVRRFLENENISQTNIEAKVFSWQSYLFNDNIVGLFGYRTDDTSSFTRATTQELGVPLRLSDNTYNPEATRLSATPSLMEKGITRTWSVVARYPEDLFGELPWGADLQAHYARSENFNPVGLRNDVLGRPINQPTGTTEEYGFLIGVQNNRFTMRINKFETALKDINAGIGINPGVAVLARINAMRASQQAGIPFSRHLEDGWIVGDPANFPIQNHEQWYSAQLSTMPDILLDSLKPRQVDLTGDGQWNQYEWDAIPNLTGVQDRVARGYEVEFVANPTQSWRMMVSLAKQETVQSNTAPLMAQVVEEFVAAQRALRLGEFNGDFSYEMAARPYDFLLVGSTLAPIRSRRALDNTVSLEQRKWRVIGVSKYEFREGRLNGFGVGGAIRWESKAATGYVYAADEETGVPFPVLDKPHYDDGLFSADAWLSYKRKIFNGRYDWSIQLNIRNLIGEKNDIPVVTNPDGKVAAVRIPNPRTTSLTSTIAF